MKISFLEPHLKTFGGIRRIIELSNRLTLRGHAVTIYHSDGSPCNWMPCIATIKPRADILLESHDALIYNDPNPTDFELVKRANSNLKVFYVLALYNRDWLVGFHLQMILPLPWFQRMQILKKSLRSSYLKLTNATWAYDWLLMHMGIHSELVVGGVNQQMFHPVEVTRQPNVIKVLCSGDPRERKGTDTVLKALELAQEGDPRIRLETYHGKGVPQSDMARLYSSADIFVDGQWYAGWNNPVAEAMACKVPVVCTDIGGVADFAFHEKTALLVPVRNPQAMADAILQLVKDASLRDTLRESGYQQITQFDWDESADKLEYILQSHLNAPSFNTSYTGARHDIFRLVPPHHKRILDVGCSTGEIGEQVTIRNKAEVTGIELDAAMAVIAATKLHQVIVSDIEQLLLVEYFPPTYFDTIIFADVLEHLRDPWKVLSDTSPFLKKDGIIILSIPNVRHFTTLFSLIFKRTWPYRQRGIHDRTHLRFFAFNNVKEMLVNAGYEWVHINRKYRIIEKPNPFNRLAKLLAFPPFRDFLAYQYIIVARKHR